MKKRIFVGIFLVISMTITACGASSSKSDSSVEFSTMDVSDSAELDGGSSVIATEEAAMEDVEMTDMATGDGQSLTTTNEVSTATAQNDTQKLIKDVYMNVETKQFDDLLTSLSKSISELGGYIESSQTSGDSYNYDSSRYACLTVRIPCEKLDSFVSIVDENANVTNKSESTQDVTLSYVDMSSHVEALRAEQESLMNILEKATLVEDIIKIQSQLTDVRYQIESYESQLRTYDNLVTYSTVTIDISEVEKETATETKSFSEKIEARLSANLYDISQGFLNFTIWFISSIPYLLIWAVVIGLLIFLFRKKRIFRCFHKKSRAEGKNEKEKEEIKTVKGIEEQKKN